MDRNRQHFLKASGVGLIVASLRFGLACFDPKLGIYKVYIFPSVNIFYHCSDVIYN